MKRVLSLIGLIALAATAARQASAEGTKELYKDAGLYADQGPMNLLPYGEGEMVEQTGQTATPEGVKNLKYTIGGNFGGFLIANTSAWGGSDVVARDFSGYENGALRL